MLKIFIGYDSNEIVAYHTAVQSIIEHTSHPVSITPLCIDHLKDIYKKERDPKQSTEFSMTRFLVPYLSGYEGQSMFMDCDVILRADPHFMMLNEFANPGKAVYVVKHDYTPSSDRKFLDQVQWKYDKKNWSSVMYFNNELCKALTPSYVSEASGLDLHQFKWLEDESMIGDLPSEWNHLVGECKPNPDAKLVHYTKGTPCFSGYEKQEHSDLWHETMEKAMSAQQVLYATIRREFQNDPALSGGNL
jgi:hypothetical protein|tara:strand:- start:358 stop:1098 length:741 start_codon:yes stop_codon:yes gene_type:complete